MHAHGRRPLRRCRDYARFRRITLRESGFAMRTAPRLALLFAGLLAHRGAFAAESATHCQTGETVVFQCATGRKLLSVCAVPGQPGANYRYGAGSKPELLLPDPAAPAATTLSGDSFALSGGGGAFLRFRRADYAYTVYTAIGRGWGEKAGVVVEQAGQRVAALRCRGPVQSVLGPEWFKAAQVAADGTGFDLP